MFLVSGTTGMTSECALLGSRPKGVGAAEYGNVLLHGFIPAATELYGERRQWFLMQDSAPGHTAQSTSVLLSQRRVRVLDWPANSPDLNPIENAWAIVQHRLRKKACKTFEKYKTQLQQEWHDLEHDTIKGLIYSMKTRLQLVIDAEGGVIDY